MDKNTKKLENAQNSTSMWKIIKFVGIIVKCVEDQRNNEFAVKKKTFVSICLSLWSFIHGWEGLS